jgi:hypothetical protein
MSKLSTSPSGTQVQVPQLQPRHQLQESRRQEKIEALRAQIGALQTDLVEEEAALELE